MAPTVEQLTDSVTSQLEEAQERLEESLACLDAAWDALSDLEEQGMVADLDRVQSAAMHAAKQLDALAKYWTRPTPKMEDYV